MRMLFSRLPCLRTHAGTFSCCLLLLFPAYSCPAADSLAWKAEKGFRYADLTVPPGGKSGFSAQKPDATGISFTNVLAQQRGITNQVFLNGSGLAAGDVDGDGWCDLYFCGLDSPNALYRNLGGWRFKEITDAAGVACAEQASTGAVLSDVDGDGDLDLLVSAIGRGVRLFLNDGKGKFAEATDAAGLQSAAASTSMALADMDGDGDLDLYVANYRTASFQDQPGTRFRVGTTNNQSFVRMVNDRPLSPADQHRYSVDPVTLQIRENGEADVLYRNDGAGHFTALSWTDGTFVDEDGNPAQTPYDWGLSVMFRDLNGDGAPDIYVCNDNTSPDRIWSNNGVGRFRALPRLAIRQTSLSSMGVDVADIDRDGLDDIFVVDMLSRDHVARQQQLTDRHGPAPLGVIEDRPQYMRNTLFLNRGDGTYAEIARLCGLEASDWSWLPVFLDVDLDGYEDVLISNGIESGLRNADARRQIDQLKAQGRLTPQEFYNLKKLFPRQHTPNFAFRNRGDLTFADVSNDWNFNSTNVSQGMALADLDRDGDLDVILNCMNAPALLCRNESSASRLAVRLKGNAANSQGIGATIRVRGGPVSQSQEMISGGRYVSSDEAMRVFAAGTATNLSLEITWRDGRRTSRTGVRPNRVYEVNASTAVGVAGRSMVFSERFFSDVSERIQHVHFEDDFDDFAMQPLLPRQLSRLGPGASWIDFNNDGFDDLMITAGRGGELAFYANDHNGGFRRINIGQFIGKFSGDATQVLGWASASGGEKLFIGVSNYEDGGVTDKPRVLQYEIWVGGIDARQHLPATSSSIGPLAAADVDGDGDLDLFFGGRVKSGRYPQPASSAIYFMNEKKQLEPEFVIERDLSAVGLVSGAVFSDLNGDGLPELILACDWGPVKVLWNEKKQFVDVTERLGLARFAGWWNSVTTGDFDSDGRMDIVAGNWGRNTRYQYYLKQPLQLFYGNGSESPGMELFHVYFDPALNRLVPWRFWDTVSEVLPDLQVRFGDFASYSKASAEEILGDARLPKVTATSLDSMVFLNRGDHFEPRSLPLEAQFTPVFGLCVADFDGDGNEDLFLAQNFFDVSAEVSRYDAGRGLWLKGNGKGDFEAVPGQESGILVYGEQRGAAVSDFDGDRRVDLVVTQNGAATKLYRNERGKPGLRVRLKGPPENPSGVGAFLRLVYGKKVGPAREIHAGSGYWSQDSLTPIMSIPEPPTQIWVRWPGDKLVVGEIPKDATEITVDVDGKVTAGR